MSFFKELKRRNVFKVGAAYLVVAWLIAQVMDIVLDPFGAPQWVMKTTLVLLAAGFLVSLLLAWAYELTPEGVRKESEVDDLAASIPRSGRSLGYAVFGLLALAAVYLFVSTREPQPDPERGIDALVARPSVVVLPFANISGDPTYDYLAFGVTDELIAGLQRLGNFPVVSRNASLSYGLTNVSAIDFAQNHGAAYLVEGSVNVGSNGIRVLVNLSSSDGNQVWAERYQLKDGQADVFAVSDELVSKVAGAVLESEVKRVQRKDRPPADAWEHYIKALRVVLDYDHLKYNMARDHLNQAVEIAPEMAEAWWALGELEVMRYMTGPSVKDTGYDDLYELIGYFRKAHELSPFHAAACGCLGYMLTAVGQPDQARVVFEQAIEAKPLSPDLRVDYAIFLAWAGRYDEALDNAELALKLGPVSQDRAGVWTVRSLAALSSGDEKAALDAINRAMFISANTFYAPAGVAILYLLGQHNAAQKLLQGMQEVFPDMEPKNPVFYVTLKPIDDILAQQRKQGRSNGPVDVAEIYSILREDIEAD